MEEENAEENKEKRITDAKESIRKAEYQVSLMKI